jgi:hypothetical protein
MLFSKFLSEKRWKAWNKGFKKHGLSVHTEHDTRALIRVIVNIAKQSGKMYPCISAFDCCVLLAMMEQEQYRRCHGLCGL